MSVYFADTSSFAKRYVTERGTNWMRSITDQSFGHIVAISAIGTVEFLSLIARRLREGAISPSDHFAFRNDFLFHSYHQYTIVPLSPSVITQAQILIERHPLRTLDALQLASALVAARFLPNAPIFLSADVKLLTAASAEGLLTDDPNAHP